MAKHVHIYLPAGMSNRFVPAKVKDKAPCGCSAKDGFEESKHPRNHGKFASTSGPAGGTVEHHKARAQAHHEALAEKGATSPDSEHHAAARYYHTKAGEHLQAAQMAHAMGPKNPKAGEHHGVANQHSAAAAESEKRIGGGPAAPSAASPAAPAAESSYQKVKNHPNYSHESFAAAKAQNKSNEAILAEYDKKGK